MSTMNMEFPDDLGVLNDNQLEQLRQSLHKKSTGRSPKGVSKRNEKKRQEFQNAALQLDQVRRLIAERVLAEQLRVRDETQQTLIASGVSALKIDDWHEYRQLEGDLAVLLQEDMTISGARIREVFEMTDTTNLSFEETIRLHEVRGAAALESKSDWFQDCNVTEFDSSSEPRYPWVQSETSSIAGVQDLYRILALDKDAEGAGQYTGNSLVEPSGDAMVIRTVPVTSSWAAIAHARSMEYLTTLKDTDTRNGHVSTNSSEANRKSMHAARIAAQALSNPERRYDDVISENAIASGDLFIGMAESEVQDFIALIHTIDDTITTRTLVGKPTIDAPKSIEEIMFRLEVHASAMIVSYHGINPSDIPNSNILFSDVDRERLIPAAQLMMDSIPEEVFTTRPEVLELFSIMCPEICNNEALLSRLLVVSAGGRFHVVISDDIQGEFEGAYSDSFASFPQLSGEEDWIDADQRMLASLVRSAKPGGTELVSSFPLPTMVELENHFFDADNVSGRFLSLDPEDGDVAEDVVEDDIQDDVPKDTPVEWSPVRRMRELRRALLQEGVHATFSYDETEPSNMQSYSELARGHYAVVTITDIPLQIIISDDPQLGCYQVLNNNQPIGYTSVNLPEISQMGATPINWDTPEQFVRSVRTSIEQQRTNPMHVYPVHPSVDCPLDALHLESKHDDTEALQPALDGLRIDIDRVAARAGKETEPWTVSLGDFGNISSGKMLWSFGGNAHGSTYLDRVARRIGLHHLDFRAGSEGGLRQDHLRSYTLHTILRALYPDDTQSIEAMTRSNIEITDQTPTRDQSA